jgi:hypothetical protein
MSWKFNGLDIRLGLLKMCSFLEWNETMTELINQYGEPLLLLLA